MIAGYSHSFDVGVAKTLGLHAAIVFNHIVYWLRINSVKNHNIHDGKVWMYETQKDIADFLEYMTLDEVKKAIGKLLKSGLLIKGNYNVNPFDKTAWYSTCCQNIYKIKKILSKEPCGSMDKADPHDAPSPQAPCIGKEQEEHIQKEQQQQDAAVPLKKVRNKKTNPNIYEQLKPVDIPESDKIEITKRYDEDTVIHAIKWVSHPTTKINKGLAPALKWACQNKPEIPLDKEAVEEKNKSYASRYEGIKNGSYYISACNKYVEIVHAGCAKAFSLPYNAHGFMDQFHSALRKRGFNVL